MKSKVRRAVLAYGVAKACQGLWFPVVRSRGRHKWLQPLWLLLWRNLKVGLHMLRVNTSPSALSLTHNWAELTHKHFTAPYSEIDRSLRETREGYMAVTQLQWPVAVAAIAHNSTCQRWGRPCFYWNNLSVKNATHFQCPQMCSGVWHQMLFVILSVLHKKGRGGGGGGGGGEAEGRKMRWCCVVFLFQYQPQFSPFKKITRQKKSVIYLRYDDHSWDES